VAVWLSHTAPFFLAVLGIVLLARQRFTARPAMGTIIAIGAVWIASFAVVYLISLRDLAGNEVLRDAWSSAFPSSPFSRSAARWLVNSILGLFEYAFGSRAAIMGIFAALTGTAVLLTVRPAHAVLFAVPIGLALIAAFLGRYPFQHRLTLFAFPLLALLAGAGVESVRRGTRQSTIVLALFISLLLFEPMFVSLTRFRRPGGREEIRPAMAYMQRHAAPDDTVYLTPHAEWAFRYYASRLGLHPRQVVIGNYRRGDWTAIAADLEQLRHRGRVWVVLSHFIPEENQFIRYHVDLLGAKRDAFTATGAAVLLYDFR
jgi:hypothetical protein